MPFPDNCALKKPGGKLRKLGILELGHDRKALVQRLVYQRPYFLPSKAHFCCSSFGGRLCVSRKVVGYSPVTLRLDRRPVAGALAVLHRPQGVPAFARKKFPGEPGERTLRATPSEEEERLGEEVFTYCLSSCSCGSLLGCGHPAGLFRGAVFWIAQTSLPSRPDFRFCAGTRIRRLKVAWVLSYSGFSVVVKFA